VHVTVGRDDVLGLDHPEQFPVVLLIGVARYVNVIVDPGALHLQLGFARVPVRLVEHVRYDVRREDDLVAGLQLEVELAAGDTAQDGVRLPWWPVTMGRYLSLPSFIICLTAFSTDRR